MSYKKSSHRTKQIGVNAALLVALTTGFFVSAAEPTSNTMVVIPAKTAIAQPLSPLTKNLPEDSAKLPLYTKEEDDRAIQESSHANEIQDVISKKIMSGYSDGLFYPQKEVTREETAVLFSRLLGRPNLRDHKQVFADILPTHWSADDIHRVTAAGIMTGYNNGTFKGTQKITRLEFAVTAANYLHAIHYVAKTSVQQAKQDAAFNDYGTIPRWAQKNIDLLAHEGFLDSGENISFHPNEPITREDAAVLLSRLAKVRPQS